MDGVTSLSINSVISSRRQWDSIVYDDLGQIEIGKSSSHLLQTIIKPITIVDAALIKGRLRNTKLCHGVCLGLNHMLTKGNQLHCQIGLHLLCLLTTTGFLLKYGSFTHQLLVEGTNDLNVLGLFLVL